MDLQMYGEDSRFKLRTSALIIENGQLLLTKNTHDPMFYTVGGKVSMGETTKEAVIRESLEETGIEYEIDRLVYVQELFYDADFLPGAQHFHEIIFHYLMKSQGVKTFEQDSFTQQGYQEHLYWVPLEEVKDLYTYPRFLGDQLLDLPKEVEHIITYEEYK